MKKLKSGMHRFTVVEVADEPGSGGASHVYYISEKTDMKDAKPTRFGQIKFQKGPIKESGVNGCFMEDLLAIVIDRLQGFQSGSFACRENELALTKIEEAVHWLNHRTMDRINRGVEGELIE